MAERMPSLDATDKPPQNSHSGFMEQVRRFCVHAYLRAFRAGLDFRAGLIGTFSTRYEYDLRFDQLR